MTDGNDEVDDEAAHFGEHDGGHGWPTSDAATGRRSIAGPMSHSRGYLGGESPLGARGGWGRSHKRPQPPKAYFKTDDD